LQAAHLILYVRDQSRSTDFYRIALDSAARLDVPGMTEFELRPGCVLGLMPEAGISRLIGPALPDPVAGRAGARAELYLVVADASAAHGRAIAAGGVELSAVAERSWGHRVGYVLDPDGHVLAFAEIA